MRFLTLLSRYIENLNYNNISFLKNLISNKVIISLLKVSRHPFLQNRSMQLQQVNVNQLSAKIKSKRELYNFFLQDCQAYLPPMDGTNVYFLK